MKMNDDRKDVASAVELMSSYLGGNLEMFQYLPPELAKFSEFPRPTTLTNWEIKREEIKGLISSANNEIFFSEEKKASLIEKIEKIYGEIFANVKLIEEEFENQRIKSIKDMNIQRLTELVAAFKSDTLPQYFGGNLLPLIAHNLWQDIETEAPHSAATPLPSPTIPLQSNEKENEKEKEKQKEKTDAPLTPLRLQKKALKKDLKRISSHGGWTNFYPAHLLLGLNKPHLSVSIENNTGHAQTITALCMKGKERAEATGSFRLSNTIPPHQVAIYKNADSSSGFELIGFKSIKIGESKESYSSTNTIPTNSQLNIILTTGKDTNKYGGSLSIGVE